LADGVGKAKSGSDQVAQGSKDLATGIGSAADGSGKLSEGLQTASDGATAIPDGAGKLSKEGAKELTKNGAATALDFGRRYGLLSASANRAKTEAMPYGAPEGAAGATAYSLKLAGDTGEGGRSWVRLLLGLAVFGVAIGATGLLRRRLSR
jgi:X-X-X-Leu-X-X-Gly heptad repeat protein